MKYASFLVGVLLVVPFIASAADPSVASFISGPNSINSAQIASFSWNVANSGGYSFSIPCTQGIKFKKTDGSVFPCNTPLSSVLTSIDGIDLNVWNLSGATKSFTASITPKDASGVNFPSARQDIQVSVTPVAHPIESITGATTASSSAPYTLSWSGGFIEGVNLSISCTPTIRTTSSSYVGYIPCNTYISPNGLPASGSITFVFNNSAIGTENITFTITPMMAPGIYNGMQPESVTVSVKSNIAPTAITTSFTTSASPERVPEGSPTQFSWVTSGAMGANIILSCNEHISTTITVGSASSTPKCSTPAFGTAMPTNGSGTLLFANNSFTSEPIIVTLVPQLTDGNFDATHGKELTLRILPKSVPSVLPIATTSQTSSIVPPATAQPSTPTPVVLTTKKIFTRNLVKGSSGSEVRALQEFLKKDHTIYPEGIVSGTFGPATERAVKRFQSKYKLGSIGTPGYGSVGPKTRDVLNSLNK